MTTQRCTFSIPNHIEYGSGAVKDLPRTLKEQGFKRGLLVTDEGLYNVGTPELVKKYFTDEGIDLTIFKDVKSNPTDDNCYAGGKLFRETKSEFVIGLGGGSPLDVGKVVKCLATHDEKLENLDYLKNGTNLIKNNMPPYYAVPTTAGTGSEVGQSSIITITSTHKKACIYSPYFMPDIAVLDPDLTVSLPAELTAATGVDAFVHCIEPFEIPSFNPVADGIAREAMCRIYKQLTIALENPKDISARGEMLVASAMGATAFQKGLGINHSIAHALGAIYDMHHGLANSAVMIEVLKYNCTVKAVAEKIASLGSTLNVENTCDAVIEALERWLVSLQVPTDLKKLNLKEKDLQAIEDYVFEDPCFSSNPKKVEKGDIIGILKKVI
jgi:4-hydroxybutyrate dehydrogenase